MTCLGLTTRGQILPDCFEVQAVAGDLALIACTERLDRAGHAAATCQLSTSLDPFLPFGPNGGSAAQVAAIIKADPEPWEEALRAIAGCGEIVLTAAWAPQTAASGSSATSWLEARAAAVRAARQAATRAHAAVLDYARSCRISALASRCVPFSGGADLALLIPKGELASALPRLARLTAPGIDFTVTGPWPCFSFAPSAERPIP